MPHALQGLDAIKSRHPMVEEDDVIMLLRDHVQAFIAALRHVNLHTGLLQQAFHHRDIHHGIIHHEDSRRGCREGFLVFLTLRQQPVIGILEIPHGLPVPDLLLHGKGKDRAFAVDAGHFQPASHEGEQPLGDVHAQPCPLDGAVALFFDALEGMEQLPDILFPDADARIPHTDIEKDVFLILPLIVNEKSHRSRFRVLYGIRENIGDDLLDADLIAEEDARYALRYLHHELQSLFLRSSPYHIHQIVEHGAHGVFHRDDVHLPRLDFREVENVVHQTQKVVAGKADVLCILPNGLVLALPKNHLIHSQNGIDGRADLMAHVGEELGLRQACVFRLDRHLLEILRSDIQEGGKARGKRDDLAVLAVGAIAEIHCLRPLLHLPFPHAHGDEGGIEHAALSLVAVDFRLPIADHQVRAKTPIVVDLDLGMFLEEKSPVAASHKPDPLRGEIAHLLAGLPCLTQDFLRIPVAQAELLPLLDIPIEIEPLLLVIAGRHTGNQAAVALNHQWELTDVEQKLVIRLDVQIAPVNIRRRHIVNAGDACGADAFRHLQLTSQRLPAEDIIRPYMQTLSTEDHQNQALLIELTSYHELAFPPAGHGIPHIPGSEMEDVSFHVLQFLRVKSSGNGTEKGDVLIALGHTAKERRDIQDESSRAKDFHALYILHGGNLPAQCSPGSLIAPGCPHLLQCHYPGGPEEAAVQSQDDLVLVLLGEQSEGHSRKFCLGERLMQKVRNAPRLLLRDICQYCLDVDAAGGLIKGLLPDFLHDCLQLHPSFHQVLCFLHQNLVCFLYHANRPSRQFGYPASFKNYTLVYIYSR